MVSIAVAYGESDASAADTLQSSLESYSDVSVEKIEGDSSLDYDHFDGIIAVGGRNASNTYLDLYNHFNWETPDEELNVLLGKYPWVVNGVDYQDVGVEITDYRAGIPVVGISGYTRENTLNATKYFTGDKTTNEIPLTSKAAVDDFVDAARDAAGENQDPAEDPTDPVIDDPEEPQSSPDWIDLVIERQRSLEGGLVSGMKDYSFTVSGQVEAGDLADTGYLRKDKVLSNDSAEGNIGVGGKDSWRFTEEITNFSYQGSDDLTLFIDGEKKIFDAEQQKIVDPGNTTDDDEEEKGFLERFKDALKNPFGNINNIVLTSIALVAAVLGFQILSALNKVLGVVDR